MGIQNNVMMQFYIPEVEAVEEVIRIHVASSPFISMDADHSPTCLVAMLKDGVARLETRLQDMTL